MSEDTRSVFTTKMWHPGGDFPVLFDRYQVLGVIGEGGMGRVFKGYHLNLKRFVDIKTLRIDRGDRPGLMSRFRREMESVGQMDHPNVVRASDAGEKNGIFYLVMEYLVGTDLSRLVTQRGPLAVADACELARQVALGLDHIHQTLVHRDIKPSNLMLTTAGLVKILDLGVARFSLPAAGQRDRTPEGCTVGTFAYMAPEQAAASARIDGRADLYSLGCTLFKLLTGRPPFSGPDYDSAARLILAHSSVPLSAADGFASIPPALGAVLLRMTAKDPDDRYQTGQEVVQALTPFAAGSQPALLLGQETAEPHIRELPRPLPEEIARLTRSPGVTPSALAPAPASGTGRSLIRRRLLALAACLLVGGLALLAWVAVPRLLKSDGDSPDPEPVPAAPNRAGLRLLDELPLHTYHPLLDRPSLPVGHDTEQPRKWRWDEGLRLLEVKGSGTFLFPLGTTTRSRFTFEAGIDQAPWSGNVGLFWGYREDAAIRRDRKPGPEFATFAFLLLAHRVGASGEDVYSVRRGSGALRFDRQGELLIHTHYHAKHDLPQLVGGEKMLQIVVDQGLLRRALFGSIELTSLCSDGAGRPSPGGALGLLALGHRATFANVRFLASSNR
jgi:serine/threonine protein kinase